MQAVEPDIERHLDAAQNCGPNVVEGDLETGDGVGTHAASLRRSTLSSPVPWQELVEPVGGMIGDAGEHVGAARLADRRR